MKIKIDKINVIKLLIVLLVINYMVVTIILNDNIVLKYLRDILLITLFFITIYKKGTPKNRIWWILFSFVLIIAFIQSDNKVVALTTMRKYIFPLIAFFVAENCISIMSRHLNRIIRFSLIFFSLISFWGIFQAWVLGDVFLRNIGYKVSYSYGYGRDMLNYSFYFGGLGIQRVVSTLSNSNVCGLILGAVLIFLVYTYKDSTYRYKNMCMILILTGYMLTFSRSNFLALFIVVVVLLYPYIPHKKILWLVIGACGMAIIIVGIAQGKSGIIYKLWEWVINTITLSESSVAGRSVRWIEAFEEVIKNPFGIGFGHVGALAINAGESKVFDCENSYLAIALDCGLFGLIIYYTNIISIIMHIKRIQRKTNSIYEKKLCMCGESMLLYMLIVMFFSNHIYDMEAIAIVMIYVGFVKNMLNVYGQSQLKERNL